MVVDSPLGGSWPYKTLPSPLYTTYVLAYVRENELAYVSAGHDGSGWSAIVSYKL